MKLLGLNYFKILIAILLISGNSNGQSVQTIRGTILDKQSETPILGAAVSVLSATPVLGNVTDMNGNFVIQNVPVGRHIIQISYLGYHELLIPNTLVSSGKEVVLEIKMEEATHSLEEIIIAADADKDRPINELATVSSRQFNVEEVRRYSGGRNDIAKLVGNFAGVAANNDQRNDIIIRGNSPTGVLWRMEGVPIPNPNHFTTIGTTGGPVSALNPNMISNSDFLTSAFPAEYGNALAGVFDIGLRSGNKEKYEFTGQLAAFSGFEAMAEGPMNKKNGGSFLVAYRHSFVEIANKVGISYGTTAVPAYKDLSFNLNFGQGKYGKISLFGIGGYSKIEFLGKELDTTDIFADPSRNAYNISKFGVVGLKHNILLNSHSYLKTILSTSYTANLYQEDDLRYDDQGNYRIVDFNESLTDYRLSSLYNNKLNSRWTIRAGFLATFSNTSTLVKEREDTPDIDGDGKPDWFTGRDYQGNFLSLQEYAQVRFKINEKWTLNAGAHALYFDITNQIALDPRTSIEWIFSAKQSLSFAYGLHHQIQPLPVFLRQERLTDGTYIRANQNLDFTRSHHFVLSYDLKPSKDWRIKAETYYQSLGKVPVDPFPSTFSMLNAGADWVFPENTSLVNEGTGRNIGIEFTLEKFFSKSYYTLVTASVFDSKYKASDNIERNTAFNGGYVLNVLAGKEFKFGKAGRNAFTMDTKFTTAGGRYDTPVDLEASLAAGTEKRKESEAYSERYDNYLRWDIKLGYRMNHSKKKISQTFYLDFQNVTNHKNIFRKQYSDYNKKVGTLYQIGFFPDILYRIEF
ncbi:MAG: TonB-dependent receptor [Saprospiraceae bacterium]|nr:TonB-dependent receptor [Saprospiraceae bacterium]